METRFGVELELVTQNSAKPPPSTAQTQSGILQIGHAHLLERLADLLNSLWRDADFGFDSYRHSGNRLFGRNGNALRLLGAVIADGRFDGVFGKHRAVNLHRRQTELIHDVRVLDFERFVNRFASSAIRVASEELADRNCRSRRS